MPTLLNTQSFVFKTSNKISNYKLPRLTEIYSMVSQWTTTDTAFPRWHLQSSIKIIINYENKQNRVKNFYFLQRDTFFSNIVGGANNNQNFKSNISKKFHHTTSCIHIPHLPHNSFVWWITKLFSCILEQHAYTSFIFSSLPCLEFRFF